MEEDGDMFPSIENHNGRKATKVNLKYSVLIVSLKIFVRYPDIILLKIW